MGFVAEINSARTSPDPRRSYATRTVSGVPSQVKRFRIAARTDLRRQAVEALRAAVRTRQQQVTDGARDAPVAVVERMQGDEPQMAQASPD